MKHIKLFEDLYSPENESIKVEIEFPAEIVTLLKEKGFSTEEKIKDILKEFTEGRLFGDASSIEDDITSFLGDDIEDSEDDF